MPTPGIFYVNAKIINPALTPSVLQKWYDEVHFPDIVATSGMPATLRYEAIDYPSSGTTLSANANTATDRPFFYYYPMRDLAFLASEEFRAIPITSDLLPGPRHLVFDSVDFDTRCYELVQVFEPEGKTGMRPGPAPLLITSAMTATAAADADASTDIDTWYRQEALPALAHCRGFRRTRRYKLSAAMQTAMMRAIAMPPSEGDSQTQKEEPKITLPPTWLALHEFDGAELPVQEIVETQKTPWARRVLEGLQVHEYRGWRFVRGAGEVEFEF